MRYVQRPVVFEAFQITEQNRASNEHWPWWLHDAWNLGRKETGAVYPSGDHESPDRDRLVLQTEHGSQTIDWGSWLIRGVAGFLHIYPDHEFIRTYEPYDEPNIGMAEQETRHGS